MFPVLSCFRQKLQLPKICVMKFYDPLKIFNATCFMSARQCYEKVLWPILQLFISSRTIFIRSSSNGLLLTLMIPITVFIPTSKSSRRVFVDFNFFFLQKSYRQIVKDGGGWVEALTRCRASVAGYRLLWLSLRLYDLGPW